MQQNSGFVPITGFEPADPQLLATASTTDPAVPYQKWTRQFIVFLPKVIKTKF